MRRIVGLGLALVLVLVMGLAACGGGDKIWRPEGETSLSLEGKKLLVMPMRVNLPGDDTKLNAAVFGGFIGALGSDAISLQPVQPALEGIGLGGLSSLMARGLVWAAWHGGKFEGEFGELPGKIATLLEKAGELLSLPDLKVDYIIVGHVYRTGGVAEFVKYKVIGGAFDPKENKIMCAFEYEKNTAESALLAEMAMLGKDMASKISGEAPAEGGEEAPAEGGESAPAEGGEAAPAEGGEAAPAEGGEAPAEGGE